MTGERNLVFVVGPEGALEPREIVLGARAGDRFQVLDGLSGGERIVASANFLVDAESRLASGAGMAGMPGMAGTDAGVPVDRATARRLGITFARAAPAAITRSVRLAGTLTYPEPRQVFVNARVHGWVEHLYADYVGKPVREGEPLLALYSPELVSAQEEYLTARRLGDSSLVAAARRRLGPSLVAAPLPCAPTPARPASGDAGHSVGQRVAPVTPTGARPERTTGTLDTRRTA